MESLEESVLDGMSIRKYGDLVASSRFSRDPYQPFSYWLSRRSKTGEQPLCYWKLGPVFLGSLPNGSLQLEIRHTLIDSD